MVIELPLTQGRIALLSEEDDWALDHRWCVSAGYPARGGTTQGRRWLVYLHRAVADAMGLSGPTIDHINRDRFDCRRENLRPADYFLQNRNQGLRSTNTSGVIGVSYRQDCGLWEAGIRWDGRRYRKSLPTLEEAVAWRENKVAELEAC